MGRKPYTLIWGIAFLVVCLQKLLNIVSADFPSFELYWIIVCALSILTVILGSWGHMLRTGVKLPIYYVFIAGGLATLVTAYFTVVNPHVGLRMSVYIYSNAVMLVMIGIVIWRFRPQPLPAEIGTSLSYILFGVLQAVAATFALLQGAEADPRYANYYVLVNLASLPVAFTAMGLFVVFILASDLSEEMKVLAMTDPLTKSLNRRGFYDLAQNRINKMLSKSQYVCLIYWDIDHFKKLNDSYGHAAGDEVLIQTVKRVNESIKKDDLLGRLGGEEFVVLLGRVDSKSALEVAERLRRKIEALVIDFENRKIQVTASFGVAVIKTEEAVVERVIDIADKALYQAKLAGRNRVVMA